MDKRLTVLPSAFLDKLQKIYPHDYYSICRTFLQEKNTTFRLNLLKCDAYQFAELLEKHRIRAKKVHWLDSAYILDFPSQRELEKTQIYTQGIIYVQNISSMIPVMVLDPQPNEKILDLCAAPGGKTTQIISVTHGKALVTAVEVDKPRWCKLEANIKIQGHESYITLILGDGVAFGKQHENEFDRVLVDAPCSGESGFDVHSPRSYSYWSERTVKGCFDQQKKLAAAGAKALKPGGILVYSTCTFSPEENEEVVQWLLEKFPQELQLEEVTFSIPGAKTGLTTWKDRRFAPQLKYTRRVIPSDILEAFYVARFRKKIVPTEMASSLSDS